MAATLRESPDWKYDSAVEPTEEPEAFYSFNRNGFIGGKAVISERFPEELLPRRFRFTRGRKIYDWVGFTNFSLPLCSTRLKELIESIEPGVHQFVSVEVFHKDGTPYGETYWLVQCCTVIDAISPDLGGVEKQETMPLDRGPLDVDYVWNVKIGGGDKLSVYKDRIAGRAMWRDRRLYGPVLISDALITAMEARGIEGWHAFQRWHEV